MEIEKRLLRKGRFDGKLSLEFKDSVPNGLQAKEDYLPVRCSIGNKKYPKGFDGDAYFSNLKSVTLGKSVLYVPITTSTMNVYDRFVSMLLCVSRLEELFISDFFELQFISSSAC